MDNAAPDFIRTEKRLQFKRNSLFITGSILLLLSGTVWLFSWMLQFDLESLYSMAKADPINLRFNTGLELSHFSRSIADMLLPNMRFIVPLAGIGILAMGIYFARTNFIIPFAFLWILLSFLFVFNKSFPDNVVTTSSMIKEGGVDKLLRSLTLDNPSAGRILKEAIDKGINNEDAVADLKSSMSLGSDEDNAQMAMFASLSLVQVLTVAAHENMDKSEAARQTQAASKVAGLNVRLMNGGVFAEKALAFRLYELAQQTDPSVENRAKNDIDSAYLKTQKTTQVLRTLKVIFFLMAIMLIILSGFANHNLRVVKHLKAEV